MKWSFRIARVSGIDIRVHATFALIVLLGALYFGEIFGVRGAFFGALLVCCLFTCVVLHELGHSLVAQRLGVQVREIMLLPIGGVARLMREPAKPWHELVIALAGPLVNVVIALALLLLGLATLGMAWIPTLGETMLASPSAASLLGWLLLGNVMLAVFNMIPALPMDGGRVFRALLAMVIGKPRATQIAASLGQVLAAGLAAFALLNHDLMLALVGGFVFLGATQERHAVESVQAITGLRAGDVCAPNAVVLSPGDPLGAVVQIMLRSSQTHFAVVHGERIIGTIAGDDALRALRQAGPAAYVAGAMCREIVEVDASTPLPELRSQLIELAGRPVVVKGPNGYIGLLGLDDISRVATLATMLRRGGMVARAQESRSTGT
jgi:Zn-dependent protease/CBS domain-containing protein